MIFGTTDDVIVVVIYFSFSFVCSPVSYFYFYCSTFPTAFKLYN